MLGVSLNGEWDSAVIGFGCVSSRILWVKFRFSKVKVCVMVSVPPEEEAEKKEKFWNEVDRVVDRVGNGHRLYVLGDGLRADLTDGFEVPGEKDNGKRLNDLRVESGLCVGNTYFEQKSLHKYNSVARGQDGVEALSMIWC